MGKQEKDKLKAFLAQKLRLYFGMKLSAEDMDAWAEELEGYTPQEIQNSFRRCIAKSKGVKIVLGDLLGHCADIREQEVKTRANTMANALIKACNNFGLEDVLIFNDNVAEHAMEQIGGWDQINKRFRSQEDLADAFVKAYMDLSSMDLPVKEVMFTPDRWVWELQEGEWQCRQDPGV